MTGTVALEVTHIARRFGGLVALRDVSFQVREGEVMGLIGPNGAGKSTLFEIVSGNLPPSGGRVSFFGKDCTDDPAHVRRRAGLCRTFQKVRLFESMTVAENIAVSVRQCLPPGRDWRAEVGVDPRTVAPRRPGRPDAVTRSRSPTARKSRSAAPSPGFAGC